MGELRISWDRRKAAANLRKHRVSFDEAQTAFEDERALIIDDPDHSDVEDRFVLLGLSAVARLLVVVHSCQSNEDVIRLISARRATYREQATYWNRRL